LGAYSVNSNANEVMLIGLFGFFGYVFTVLDLEPAPLMLGLVLGPMFEEYFRRQLAITSGDFTPFVTRPISLGILCLMSTVVAYSVWKMFQGK
jgi:TctA family transporter